MVRIIEERNSYKGIAWGKKLKENIQLGRGGDNIKMVFTDISWVTAQQICLGKDRDELQAVVARGNKSSGSIKSGGGFLYS